LKSVRAEVDEQAMLDIGCLQVGKHLRFVFWCKMPRGFQLDQKYVVYKEVNDVIAEQAPILIEDFDAMLLDDIELQLPKPTRKRILIDALEMTGSVISMDVECHLANPIA
jgi:hypothetical protein